MMKYVLLLAFLQALIIVNPAAKAQSLQHSLFQYQLDALALNPAYAGSLGAPAFDASYFGNFTSSNTISRSALVSVHGPVGTHKNAGFGGVFRFYKTSNFGEVNVKPACSWQAQLPRGTLSFGATIGLNYFDFDDDGFGGSPPNFASVDGGFGIYYFTRSFFAGISALSLFEKTLFVQEDNFATFIPRENPFSLHAGFITRLYKNIQLKPSALAKYADLYELPNQANSQGSNPYFWSLDVQSTFIVDETYMIGLLYGFSNLSVGSDSRRFGVSATLVIDGFRLGYAIQRNSVRETAVELPVTHLLNAGYIFGEESERPPVRFF